MGRPLPRGRANHRPIPVITRSDSSIEIGRQAFVATGPTEPERQSDELPSQGELSCLQQQWRRLEILRRSVINESMVVAGQRVCFADYFSKCEVRPSAMAIKPRGLTNRSNYCYVNAVRLEGSEIPGSSSSLVL